MFQLPIAVAETKELLALGGDSQPVAVAFGQALGWKWPEGMSKYETEWVTQLCDLLNVNLPGRSPAVR